MRAQLLACLEGRVRGYTETSDVRLIFSPEAEGEAAALAASVTDFTADIEALRVLGWWHWCRFLALPVDRGGSDASRAMALLEPVRRERPDEVPEHLGMLAAVSGSGREAEASRALVRAAAQAWLLLGREQPEARDEAVELLRSAHGGADGYPVQAQLAGNLGTVLTMRVESAPPGSRREADRDEAIRLLEQASASLTGPELVVALVNLAVMLLDRFGAAGDVTDLETAIARLREAALVVPESSPENTVVLFNLAVALESLERVTGDEAALREAIMLVRSLEGGHPAAAPSRRVISEKLISLLERQHSAAGDQRGRESRVALLRREAGRLEADDPHRAGLLFQLAEALLGDHERTGAAEPMDEAVAMLREALGQPFPDPAVRAVCLASLGRALTLCHSQRRDQGCLDQALEALREARAMPGLSDAVRVAVASQLAVTLDAAALPGQDGEVLAEAFDLHREALQLTRPDSPIIPRLRANFGGALVTKHRFTGEILLLHEALPLLRSAVSGMPSAHPQRWIAVGNLVSCLAALHRSGVGVPIGPEWAGVVREAIEAMPPGHPDRAWLASGLEWLHEQVPDPAAQEEAARIREITDSLLPKVQRGAFGDFREVRELGALEEARQLAAAIEYSPAPPPRALLVLGLFYFARDPESTEDLLHSVRWFGRLVDLGNSEVVPDLLRPVLGIEPADDTDIATLAQALAMTVRCGEAAGDPVMLARAVSLARRLLEEVPEGDPVRSDVLNNLAFSLQVLVVDFSETRYADEAISLARAAIAEARSAGAPHPRALQALGALLISRYNRDGQAEDLDQAIAGYQAALAAAPEGDPAQRAAMLSGLAGALLTRCAHREPTLADLDGAIGAARTASGIELPGQSGHRTAALVNLGSGLYYRYQLTGDQEQLDAALDACRAAVLEAAPGSGQRPAALINLSTVLQQPGHRAGGEIPDLAARLSEAVELSREALRLVPSSTRRHVELMRHVAAALMSYVRHTGELAALDEVQSLLEQAVRSSERASGGQPAPYKMRSEAQLLRFQITGARDDGDDAVALAETVLEHAPPGSRDRPELLNDLAFAMFARADRVGGHEELTAALDLLRQAVEAASPGSGAHAAFSHHLAHRLLGRFHFYGQPADLEEAINCITPVMPMLSGRPPLSVQAKLTLAGLLECRYELTGAAADLDEALRLTRAGVSQAGTSDATLLANTGLMLGSLAKRSGDPALAEQSVRCCRAAIAAAPAGGDRNLAGYQMRLAEGLRLQFELSGDLDALHEAVTTAQEAVRHCPPEHIQAAEMRSLLALALRDRYGRTSDPGDLTDAISQERTALVASAGSPRIHLQVKANLSGSLVQQAMNTGNPAGLDEAVKLARSTVEGVPQEHSERVRRLAGLAAALLVRYQMTHQPADIAEAVRLARAASTGPASRELAAAMFQPELGAILYTGFTASGDETVLNDAVNLLRSAAASSPPGSFFRAALLHNLGYALAARWESAGSARDLDEALSAWRAAAGETTAPAATRVEAARAWGQRAASGGRPADALAGYTAATRLLPLAAWRGLDRTVREFILSRQSGLAHEAAAAALETADPARALELLEQGRSVLWAQLLETRGELAELRDAHPALAATLDRLRLELDDPGSLPVIQARPGTTDPGPAALLWSRRDPGHARRRQSTTLQKAAADWDQALAQVRSHEGFHDFLLPPAASKLAAEVHDGTAIMLNVAALRCDALLVSSSGITYVPLPGLSAADATSRASDFTAALQKLGDPRQQQQALQVMKGILHWLWETLAQPVLGALGHTTPPAPQYPWPRIWWCPAGPLTALPIHAARPAQPGAPGVLDLVVSSYTPTLRALNRARSRPQPPRAGQLLAVGVPQTPYLPGGAPLPAVEDEIAIVASRFPGRCTVLLGEQATRERILAELPRHRDIHLSCHGSQDPASPSQGSLFSYDAPITITELSRHSSPDASFAYLSACHTAASSPFLPDEALTIASAMQLIGFQHVIATLWSIRDDDAPGTARKIYDEMQADGQPVPGNSALALHHAARALRDKTPEDVSRWAPYIHLGP